MPASEPCPDCGCPGEWYDGHCCEDYAGITITTVRVRATRLPLRVRILVWQERRRRRKLARKYPMLALALKLYDEELDRAFLFGLQSEGASQTMPERR